VPLANADKEKTAFSMPKIRHYHFKTMPFRLCNAPVMFERLMEQLLSGPQWQHCLVYLDDVRSFLGLSGYYLEHISSFFELAEPLSNLTRKNVKFEWSDQCKNAFEQLKEILTSAPILAYRLLPIPNGGCPLSGSGRP
jgi:hypothetical protein